MEWPSFVTILPRNLTLSLKSSHFLSVVDNVEVLTVPVLRGQEMICCGLDCHLHEASRCHPSSQLNNSILRWNSAGAELTPIPIHSYKPQGVMKVVGQLVSSTNP